LAVGRMINKKIGLNKALHELSSDTSRLAFTWTIPHCDRDGRVHGDPSILRRIVFPRRDDITTEQMEQFIIEWAEAKLIYWYESNGDKWIQFPKFRENQSKLRYDREAPSAIPPPEKGVNLLKKREAEQKYKPPPKNKKKPKSKSKNISNNTGQTPEEVPLNLSEFNLKEFKGIPPPTSSPASSSQKNKPRDGPLSKEEIEKEKERQKKALKNKFPDEHKADEKELQSW
jgi:hypothetical protein